MAPTCDRYFGKVFAHLAAAMAVAAVSAEKVPLSEEIEKASGRITSLVILIVLLFGSLWAIFRTQPGGVGKYAAFATFALMLGQTMKPLLAKLKAKGAVSRVLTLTTGVFVGMMALGFWDNQNVLGFGPFLGAGLLGLIIAEVLVGLFAPREELDKSKKLFSMVGVALFAVFTAYDVQLLKAKSASCRRNVKKTGALPDYPQESLGLFLDFANLFSDFGNLSD